MKIFIENYSLNNLHKAIPVLKKYCIKRKFVMEIYSESGQYYVDDNGVYKLIYNDNIVKQNNKFYEDYNVLFDYSYIVKIPINQLPSKHLAMNTEYFYFSLNKTSKIFLVIQFAVTYKDNDLNVVNELVPIDFYFEINENVKNNNEKNDENEKNKKNKKNHNINLNIFFIKDELNVFFSLLN